MGDEANSEQVTRKEKWIIAGLWSIPSLCASLFMFFMGTTKNLSNANILLLIISGLWWTLCTFMYWVTRDDLDAKNHLSSMFAAALCCGLVVHVPDLLTLFSTSYYNGNFPSSTTSLFLLDIEVVTGFFMTLFAQNYFTRLRRPPRWFSLGSKASSRLLSVSLIVGTPLVFFLTIGGLLVSGVYGGALLVIALFLVLFVVSLIVVPLFCWGLVSMNSPLVSYIHRVIRPFSESRKEWLLLWCLDSGVVFDVDETQSQEIEDLNLTSEYRSNLVTRIKLEARSGQHLSHAVLCAFGHKLIGGITVSTISSFFLIVAVMMWGVAHGL